MRTSGKVQRLSVMLPCCSCLQCGHRHASSGASYKEEARVGISFQILRHLSLCHHSSAAPGQTLTPAPQVPPTIIKLIGDSGFPMLLFKYWQAERHACLMQEAPPAARQNSASAAVQRSYFHPTNAYHFEVGDKKKQKQKAGRLGSLGILTRKPSAKKESQQKEDRCTSNFISDTSLRSGNSFPPYVPMAQT